MSYTKDAAKAQFQKWSKHYDQSILQRLLFQPSHEMLLNELSLSPTARVLEIGCGTGALARRLAQRHPQCVLWGIDLSRAMLQRAAGRMGQTMSLIEGDAERLPFDANQFEVVLCAHCFHHFPHQEHAVREMHRVLRPGGQAVILDGDRDRLWGRLVYDVGVVAFEGAVHHASAGRFRDLFDQSGFRSVEQFRSGGLAPYLITHAVACKSCESFAA